jgi:signal transduction histidine kinase
VTADVPSPRELKRRGLRARILRATLASYGVDAVLLGGFAVAGTVPGWVPLAYGGAGWLASGTFHALCSRTSVATSRDPYLTIPNLIVAALIQLGAILLAPQVAFFFLTLLFIVFGIASLRLSTRGALISWLVILASMGLTLSLVADVGWLPMRTRAERVLVWLCFAVTLGRCILLGAFGRNLRDALSRRHQELTQLNADLQHGKRLLTLATEAAGIACWEYDVSSGKVLWTENEIAALRAQGVDMCADAAALIAMLHPQDAEAALIALCKARDEGREVSAQRLRVVVPGGPALYVQAHARLFVDEAGAITRLLGVCWDVTEEVRQEERRASLQEQLREASRQAGMAEVATGVLHSIGNALNSLGVSASMLNTGLRDLQVGSVPRVAKLLDEHSASLAEFLEKDPRGKRLPLYVHQLGEHLTSQHAQLTNEARSVASHVEHIASIVAAQQSYARPGGLTEEVDITELVDSAIALKFGIDSNVAVRREYQRLPDVTLDRHKLLQILANLFSNAREAMHGRPAGKGVLTVSVHRFTPGWVAIEVEDTGAGISSEALARLFTFGFTTKKDGHGFGLHSSAILAKELGGDLTAHSEGAGRGARFTLRIPLAVSEQPEASIA